MLAVLLVDALTGKLAMEEPGAGSPSCWSETKGVEPPKRDEGTCWCSVGVLLQREHRHI